MRGKVFSYLTGLMLTSSFRFRWVALQLMELKSCFTPKDVREVLRTLPKTLKETYDRIIDSVPKRNQSYIRAALQWIAYSARPLSLDELAVAVVNDPAVAKSNGAENKLFGGGETIHKMLSKLIDVHKKEEITWKDILDLRRESIEDQKDYFMRLGMLKHPGPTIVKFSHSSIRDYLLQWHDDADVSRSFSFSEDSAHRFIAKSCLAYFQSMPVTASVGNKAYDPSWTCLLMYLASHWHTHAARLPDEEPGSLAYLFNELPMALRFLLMARDEYTDETFDELVDFDLSQGKPPSPEQTLQYAACSGFHCVIDSVLASNPDLDVNASSEAGNALSFACERGYWQIADTLLKRGADPNNNGNRAVPFFDASSLFHASKHGADDIVQELIRHGADVNTECNEADEASPLAAAVFGNHPSTIKLLLSNGADPDITFNTPICTAAKYGEHECMDVLLRHGASLDLVDCDSPSLLEFASASGSVETVKLLLAQGLDADEENRLLALHTDKRCSGSTYHFNYPSIEQPGPHKVYEHYGSPMHAAAAYGHTDVIKLLVEHKAAVNRRSHYWETPATLARVKGNKEALEYLLSRGGVAAEQTEVCYRRDLFEGSGVPDEAVKLREGYGVGEEDEDDEDVMEG